MSSDMLTRCPHCKAAFKVSQEQLGIAKGKVRCGACMNVFDALAYALNDSKQDDAVLDKHEADQSKEPAPEFTNEELIQDDPEQDSLTSGYKQSHDIDDEFSTSFKELDETNTGARHDFADAMDDTINSAPDDESWATSMLEEESRSRDDDRKEPSFNEPGSFREPHDDLALNQPTSAGATSSDSIPDDSYAFNDFLNEQPSSTKAQRAEKSESISFYYDTDEDKTKRHWALTSMFVLFNIGLVLSLLVIAGWFHYEKLARYPIMASLYSQACQLANCTLPELSDLEKIRSRNLVVRSHPTQRDALIIDTVIINEAGFEQHFPSMGIYFADINNQTIAQRLITPQQYLSEEAQSWGKMPMDQAIHVSIEIVDPGKEAVNYSIKFFATETSR